MLLLTNLQHDVDMTTSLTTFDGYPRDDIDVAQSTCVLSYGFYANQCKVRITRARIIHLRNDWKGLIDRIEIALHAHFANQHRNEALNIEPGLQAPGGSGSDVRPSVNNVPDLTQETRPFAKVNSIVTGSPADQAGLQAGDEVVKFGDINWLNHEKLSQVARFVQTHEGVRIKGLV